MKYVCIKIVDICYFKDDFEYKPFIVEKDDDFEEKYKGLEYICKNYECFDDVDDYIKENFKIIEMEERKIYV